MSFTVSLSQASGRDITVHYTTTDDTATSHDDFWRDTYWVVIPAQQQQATFTITVNGDTTFEGHEQFLVNLTSADYATIADGTAIGTILEDNPGLSLDLGDSVPLNRDFDERRTTASGDFLADNQLLDEQYHAVLGDNELMAGTITLTNPSALAWGWLTVDYTDDKILVWQEDNVGNLQLIANGGQIMAGSDFAEPITLWVEGIGLSDSLRDASLVVTFNQDVNSDVFDTGAEVTVVQLDLVDIDTDSDNNDIFDRSDAEDSVETDWPDKAVAGKVIQMHDDDDSELSEAAFSFDLGSVLPGATITVQADPNLRLWTTQDRLEELPGSFALTVPAESQTFFVEGISPGEGSVTVLLQYPGGNQLDTDTIKFTVFDVGVTAYRPQTDGPGYSAPFPRTAVAETIAETLGVGIRRNDNDLTVQNRILNGFAGPPNAGHDGLTQQISR